MTDEAITSNDAAIAAPSNEDSFLNSLPEDLRGDPSIKDFKSVADLAKSYTHAKSMIGNSIRIPTEDASDEVKNEFYEKIKSVKGIIKVDSTDSVYDYLGRPASPDEYKIEAGIDLDPEMSKQFKELAHQAGLNNEQVNKLVGFEAARAQAQQEQLQHAQESAIKSLQSEWGPDYQNRLNGAKEAARAWAQKYPEVDALINDPVTGNNPGFIAMLSELAKHAQEGDSPVSLASGIKYGISASDAKDQISDIRSNRKHPYHNQSDPLHRDAVAKMNQLYSIAYSGE